MQCVGDEGVADGDFQNARDRAEMPEVVEVQVVSGVYAQGYVASPYAHGYVYNPRRLYRQALRYGYPPVFYSWPRAPINLYGYPYHGVARPPIEVWTGPNGYVAPPVYAPPIQGQVPTPADPQLRPQPQAPEPIPAPPSNPGP